MHNYANFILLISLWLGSPASQPLWFLLGSIANLQLLYVFLHCNLLWLIKTELNWNIQTQHNFPKTQRQISKHNTIFAKHKTKFPDHVISRICYYTKHKPDMLCAFIANSRISLLSVWRCVARTDFFFYALKLLRRARRKLTNTTLDVESPSQRGDRFLTLSFSAWVWLLGYIRHITLFRKVHGKMKRANLAQKMGPKRVSPEWYCFGGNLSSLKWGRFGTNLGG